MAEQGTRFQGRNADPNSGPTRRCTTCGAQYPIDFKVCPKDATSLENPEITNEDPLIGEVLAGSFCITGTLGEGGMGKVYEAEHVRLPKRFAIKVMLEELIKYPEALARFEREAQAVARISNEHVIEIVDLVRLKDGRPCLVSELLEGQELGEMVEKEGKLPLDVAVSIGRQICRGLAAAHAVGIIHRDLKPSNLFIVQRSDGRPFVKILDFGVAKLQDGAELTRTGMIVGTPAYMSPEQARGSSSIDERADVYSVGAVIYHMLTGVPPFDAEDPALILAKLLTEDPPRPRSHNKAIPDGMEHLIQRTMARNANERPKSVRELEQELAMFDEGPHAPPPPVAAPPQPTRKPSSALIIAPLTAAQAPVAPPPPAVSPDVANRARWARPMAVIYAIATALVTGIAFAASVAAVQLAYLTRGPLKGTELLVVEIAGGAAMIGVLVAAVRSLAKRWGNTPAMERLGAGLRGAASTLLVCTGLVALGWALFVAFIPKPDSDDALMQGLLLTVVPTVLGLGMFVVALRRAGKVA